MKLILAAALALAAGCSVKEQAAFKTSNPDVSVQLLFEHDGCAVYRFHDDGRDHYYAVCRGEASTHSVRADHDAAGRPVDVHEDIPTVRVR